MLEIVQSDWISNCLVTTKAFIKSKCLPFPRTQTSHRTRCISGQVQAHGRELGLTMILFSSLKEEKSTRKACFLSLESAANQKHYLAYPIRFGFPSFLLQTPNGSFQGGFLAPQVVLVTDRETGKIEAYYVYESIDSNLQGRLYINSWAVLTEHIAPFWEMK